MKLRSLLKTDFVPMLKHPRLWICPETLRFGSIIEVEDQLGHMLMANFPGGLEVVDGSNKEPPRKRTKQVHASDLTVTDLQSTQFEVLEG